MNTLFSFKRVTIEIDIKSFWRNLLLVLSTKLDYKVVIIISLEITMSYKIYYPSEADYNEVITKRMQEKHCQCYGTLKHFEWIFHIINWCDKINYTKVGHDGPH